MPSDKISKPVHEDVNGMLTVTPAINKDVKIMIESGDKILSVEPMQAKEESKESDSVEEEPATKVDVMETFPIQVLPAVDPMIPGNSNDEKVQNTEPLNSMSMDQNSDISPAKELSTENEIKNLDTKDNIDSEVASSFYTSKYYYVIQ